MTRVLTNFIRIIASAIQQRLAIVPVMFFSFVVIGHPPQDNQTVKNPTCLEVVFDTTLCGNQAGGRPKIAWFDHSEPGLDFYYVRLSLFSTEFERLDFYQKAAGSGIYIADKNNFQSDSALFTTTLYKEVALPEFDQLARLTKEDAATESETVKSALVRSSPFRKATLLPQFPEIRSPLEGTTDCSSAQVSCSANTYTFPSGTNGTAPPSVNGYPNYGCLGSTPCPAWYYMQVGVAGDITISISQTGPFPTFTPHDVDFICWGPFGSLTDGCAAGLTGTCPIPTPCCSNVNPGCIYPMGNMVDCSFSGSATETCHILNAQVGDIYILLITNFSQQTGTITFSQTAGTGVTNCNIIKHCSVIDITTNASPCDEATNTFSVSGIIEFSNPSPTGTLTITDNTAVPPVSQTFFPPFASPKPYSLANIHCDGITHYLTAAFSDSLNCILTQEFTAPSVPCPHADISGGGSICNNGTQQATVTVNFTTGAPPFTFVYAINGVNQAPVIYNSTTPYQITTSTPGTYTLVSLSVPNMGCPSGVVTGSAVVTVNPLPTATITGTTSVCRNTVSPSVTFTGGAATPPYTFTYNINGGSNLTATTVSGNSISVAAPTGVPGTFTYNLVSVQDGSSSACSQIQSGSAVVTVNPLPTATVSGTIAVCQGFASVPVTFTGAGGTQPYTFTYNINGGTNLTISTVSGSSVTISIPTNVPEIFNYNLVSVQDGSSTACSQLQAGIAAVTINPLPTASISGSVSICQDSPPALVTFTGASGTSPYTFTYTINGGTNQTAATTVGNSVSVPAPTNVAGTFTYDLVGVQDATTTGCAQFQSGSATITIKPLPTATVSGTIAVCQNSAMPSVTFTGSGSTPPYTFTYNLNGGTNQTVTTSSGNAVTVSVPTGIPGVFTYNLVSIEDAGSIVCSQLQTGSATITVNPLPTAAITGAAVVCQNSNAPVVTFTGGAATPPYTFTYNINGGTNQVVTTTLGNSVAVPVPTNIAGTFSYNLISIHDASSTACTQLQTGSAAVTINHLPTAAISGTTSACQNSPPLLVTFTGGSATPPYTFTYNINGGINQTISTVSGNSVDLPAPTNTTGAFTYNLVSVQESSSTSCSQLQPGSATITINPLPTASISGTTAVCQNSPPQLITFTGGSATPPYTFTYNINGGTSQTVSTTSGNSVTVPVLTSVPGIFTYNLVSIQDAGTTTCKQFQTGSATVTINPHPVPVISGPASTCLNATGNYVTNGAMTSYSWSVSPGGTITGGLPTNTISVLWTTTGAKTVTVNFTDANGCTATTATSYAVTVNPLPVPGLSGLNSICAGIPVTYTTDAGKQQYTWTISPGGSVTSGGTATSSSVTVNWVTAGANTVMVNYLDGNGCTASAPASLSVIVHPSPTPTIASPINPICLTSSTTYTTQAGMSGYTWSVSSGGSVIAGNNSQVITVRWDTAGAQFVTVNYANNFNCTAVMPTKYDLLVNPLPVTTIVEATGPVCQSVPHGYQAPSAPVTIFTWSVLPPANGMIASGQGSNAVTIDWQASGNETVALTGTNTSTGCISSSALQVLVHPKPNPVFTPCFDLNTTQNARKIILRGGSPALPVQGIYSGNRVSLNALSGNYEFDPLGAGAGSYPITYTYTNTFGCPASAGPVTVTVQNNPFSCGGTLTDVRDGKIYKTAFLAGHCWMTQNLNFGTGLITAPVPPQSDNCIAEKYCAPADAGCSAYGGLYQWDELMDYRADAGTKGICPPEWHVPSEAEWQQLIDNLVPGMTAPDANALVASQLTDQFLVNGFAALLKGLNYMDYTWAFYTGTNTASMYWTSVNNGGSQAVARGLNANTMSISKYLSGRGNAFSLRCVKD